MSQSVSNFITSLVVHFPVRHDSDAAENAWLQSMLKNLKPYGASVLSRAAQRIIDNRKDRRFPLPAECRSACEEIIKLDRASETPRFEAASNNATSAQSEYDRRYAHADWLITQAPIGKAAAKEGWVLSLHDFIRINGRLPTERHEIDKCKASAKGFDQAFAECVRGEAGFLSRPLLGLGESMLRRRHKIEDMVLHGVVK
jgi:hypothetical protein